MAILTCPAKPARRTLRYSSKATPPNPDMSAEATTRSSRDTTPVSERYPWEPPLGEARDRDGCLSEEEGLGSRLGLMPRVQGTGYRLGSRLGLVPRVQGTVWGPAAFATVCGSSRRRALRVARPW